MAIATAPAPQKWRLTPPMTGVCLMLLGMFLFVVNDTMGKWLVATYSVGQILLIRSCFALIVLAPFLWRFGLPRLVRVGRPRLQALRVAFSTAEVFCFYWAVRYLPLADVMTYWMAVPLVVAALSPFILNEPVGWRSWTFIVIGFCGVILALNPGGASDPWPIAVALIGMLTFAGMMITGRTLRGTPDTVLVFW
jgi:drug/metabolite transporter (DMT)-like permease